MMSITETWYRFEYFNLDSFGFTKWLQHDFVHEAAAQRGLVVLLP